MWHASRQIDATLSAHVEHSPVSWQGRWLGSIRSALERIEPAERRFVERLNGVTKRRAMRGVLAFLNQLGNGWLYVPVALAFVLANNRRAYWALGAALLAVGLAHALYPFIKRGFSRRRPFDRDPSLVCVTRPLDVFSFPSGHCMTIAAVFVPANVAFDGFFMLSALVWLSIAWARLASAHHYPSDILAGTLLGSAVAWPIGIVLVA